MEEVLYTVTICEKSAYDYFVSDTDGITITELTESEMNEMIRFYIKKGFTVIVQ